MNPVGAVLLVFLGCCSNNVFLELIVSEIPSSGNIITAAQFLFIAVEGLLFTVDFCRKPLAIPLSTYVWMVLLFVVTSVINNYALNFNISMPLHIIFRAGSLMTNLFLGVLILRRRYKMTKYISVIMITAGIVLATYASAQYVKKKEAEHILDHNPSEISELVRWIIGILMLIVGLLLSALMGIYQEIVYSRHGKHPNESLFYNHALPLPLFLLLYNDMYRHVVKFNKSAPMSLPLLDIAVPKMWIFLIGNVVTQYVGIKSVFVLTTECASLTVTLVVTLRKFISLVISIVYFGNPFTAHHWLGTALVFSGTLLFADVPSRLADLITDSYSNWVKVTREGHHNGGNQVKAMREGQHESGNRVKAMREGQHESGNWFKVMREGQYEGGNRVNDSHGNWVNENSGNRVNVTRNERGEMMTGGNNVKDIKGSGDDMEWESGGDVGHNKKEK